MGREVGLVRVDVYSRHDAYVGTIPPGDLIEFTHTDELNGEDSVAISTRFRLREGYRLVWRDNLGSFHEHVCQDPKGLHDSVGMVYTDTALNSICELFGDYIEDKRPYGYSFGRALETALEPTRWSAGTVDMPGAVSDSLTFYHTSAREALQSILECGGELETEIEVGGAGVTGRSVNIRQHRGAVAGHRRFAYGKDASTVAKTEHWGAITACYGYGKGEETDAGGYGRKLTFGDINGGVNYVEDAEAREAYGRPDGDGGHANVFGVYENDQCEDAQQLLDETQAYLDAHKVPGVTYEADVLDLVQFGRQWEGVSVGDDVQLIDTEFEPELRCEGRVSKLVTDMLGGTQTVTLGNVVETMADMWQQQQQQISDLKQHASSWDVAASTPGAYLQQIIDGLNKQFNMDGMSYCHTSFEMGTIWSSVPLDDDGNPTSTGGSAIQICSQGFRIADGTLADGSYDWRTFGTGAGFVADCIVAGTLLADLIKTGRLLVGSAENPVFMADFDAGEVSISSGAGFGDVTAGGVVVSTDVQYGLSDSATAQPTSWTTTALWQQGKHMWTRVKMTMADGSVDYTTPRRITNDKGIGAAEVIEQYYLSTSSTEQTGGQWLNSQPAWVSGRYYWTRSRIAWSDGTVTYTEPVLARGLTTGNQSTDDLDSSLDAEGTFNRLTDNGQKKGLYLSGDELYVNATYIATGTIADLAGRNYWNLSTGEFALSQGVTVGGETVSDIASSAAGGALQDAKDYTDQLDSSLTQSEVFNRLTGNGTSKGIVMSGGQLYINATYINSGTLNADLLTAGRIQSKAGGTYWDLDTGEMRLDFSGIDAELGDVYDELDSLGTQVTTAQNRANSAYNRAGTAISDASAAQSTANTAYSRATSAKQKTDRISFTSAGIVIDGNKTTLTVGPDGILSNGTVTDIKTNDATLGIKDYGIVYQDNSNSVRFWVSNTRDEIYAKTSTAEFRVTSEGGWINGHKITTS